ncbi:lipase family protein [Microbaculum sp. FT89]|uniref:lipase family protein n=1 Tax=Microbaculum sp. FT89 TaxID=3447298 RepID=UPI003F52C39D
MVTTEEYLLISMADYGDPTDPTKIEPNDLGEWSLVNKSFEEDGFYAVAYKNGNEIVIAYRGYNSSSDLNDTTRSFLGVPFEQMYNAQIFFDQVRAAHPTEQISLTGHSLGGALASAIATREGLVCRYCPAK